MASSTGQFQLFPLPVPKANRDSNPFRKGASKGVSVAPIAVSTIIEDGPKGSPESAKSAEAVVIQVYKEVSPVREPEEAHMLPLRASSPEISSKNEHPPAMKSDAFPVNAAGSTFQKLSTLHFPPPPPPPPPPMKTRSEKARPAPLQKADSSSDNKSPVIPMRSMFPRYDPGVHNPRQSYYPQQTQDTEDSPEREAEVAVSFNEYSPSVASISRVDDVIGAPKTAPASVLNFPLDALEARPPPISTIEELGKLWEATNGQGPDASTDAFNLLLTRTAEASFTFGTSPMAAFYTLDTFANNELSVSRTHPFKPQIKVPILQLTLESETNSSPQSDYSGNLLSSRRRHLITYIFPKLAAMLAIDQSDSLAAEHQLAPTLRNQMQSEAVSRAAAQEASRLYWNEAERRYELEHPAIGKARPGPPSLVINPHADEAKPVLHITITSPIGDSPNPSERSVSPDTPSYPTIAILNPYPSSDPTLPTERVPPRASTTTLPDTANDTLPPPLASLSFTPSGPILSIDAQSIITHLPSLYAIDSLVSALFSVAITDSLTNAFLADLPLYDPFAEYKRHLPKIGYSASVVGSVAGASTIGGRSYAGSVFYATVAEREEAEQAEKSMRQLRSKDGKGKSRKSLAMSFRSFAGMTALAEEPGSTEEIDLEKANSTKSSKGKKKKQKNKKHKITIQEFDLEKYGTYQSGAREGQKLPGPTRVALSAMFVLLRFIIWILTAFVSVLAKVLVVGTRAVTSDKF